MSLRSGNPWNGHAHAAEQGREQAVSCGHLEVSNMISARCANEGKATPVRVTLCWGIAWTYCLRIHLSCASIVA